MLFQMHHNVFVYDFLRRIAKPLFCVPAPSSGYGRGFSEIWK